MEQSPAPRESQPYIPLDGDTINFRSQYRSDMLRVLQVDNATGEVVLVPPTPEKGEPLTRETLRIDRLQQMAETGDITVQRDKTRQKLYDDFIDSLTQPEDGE